MRLGEAIELYWDRPDRLMVDLTGKRPMLHIPAELEKGHQDRLLPVAPEFAAFLLRCPEKARRGRVFKLLGLQGGPCCELHRVSKLVCRIGKTAGVKVSERPKRNRQTGALETVTKFAGSHDLRRSFGERWAPRVMPAVLQELMRHESIQTTLLFYVGQNAQRTADAVWDAYEKATQGKRTPPVKGNPSSTRGQRGNTSGNNGRSASSEARQEAPQAPASQGLAE